MFKFAVPIAVLAVGCGISSAVYIGMHHAEIQRATAEFDRRAENISTVLINGVEGYATAVETLKNLTSVSMQVSSLGLDPETTPDYIAMREEWATTKIFFSQMAKDAQSSFPGLQGMGWVAASAYSDMKVLEFGGKFLISPEYQHREITDDGLCDITEREEHFPIFYIEPMEENKFALGLDLSAGEVTRRAIVEARDTGQTVSTRPIEWIRQQTGQPGFCVFDALYYDDRPLDTVEDRKENLFSVAISVILVDDMVNSSLRGLDEEGLEFFVFAHAGEIDLEAERGAPIFSSNGRPESLQAFLTASAATGLQFQSTIDVMGRDWSLYCYPQPEFLAANQTTSPQMAFYAGIVVTLMLAFYLFRSADRTQRTEALVEERTNELSHTNENLQREIASRIKADERRQELQSQLVKTQKMESVGQLAGGIAHDFNNILVAIMGYSDLIEHMADSKEKVKEYIGEVKSAADRAAKLTSQLLAFSKRQIIKPEPLNLNHLISDLIDMLERLIPENIAYLFTPGTMKASVLGDSGQLEQVLVNLVLNARDAMPEGGTLRIHTQEVTINENDADVISWAKPGTFALFQVEDTGHGIPEDIREHIFEPFFTTKDTGAGTGLGLSVVFGIVDQHGGFLHVDSGPHGGTVFSVYLPCTDRSPVHVEITPQGGLEGGTETILVVEDDEQVRNIAVYILEHAGYKVFEANDGDNALQVFGKYKSDIDLILMDVVMPKLGGRDAMNRIREMGSNVPIIFASGYSDDGIHTKFILDEDLDLLAKPYSRESLLRRLRDRLDNATLETSNASAIR